MINVENIETYGWEAAVRGMRNPLNSWAQSDSHWVDGNYILGSHDETLAKNLVKAGPDHAKFMRMIGISMDITAPLYWWKEFDTYKVGTVADSCSTMHTIHEKKFTIDDFSTEHLMPVAMDCMERTVHFLNVYRENYIQTHNKEQWWQLIQLLPTSYNQKRTVSLNYEVARRQYFSRKNHKLDEWHKLCDIYETLPYAQELIVN